MCGCKKSVEVKNISASSVSSSEYTYECTYTKEQASLWLEKINCVKSNGYYVSIPSVSLYQLNLYIGVLKSVLNYQGNPCYFKKELDEIDSFITLITSMNLCLAS